MCIYIYICIYKNVFMHISNHIIIHSDSPRFEWGGRPHTAGLFWSVTGAKGGIDHEDQLSKE